MEKQLCDLLVHLILLTWGFGAGVAGLDRYSSLGETVTLPCAEFQKYENSFIYWVFSQRSESSELASDGKITVKQPERAARLEVLPNSSLRIHHLHTEDASRYECQQYVNGMLYEGGSPVVLNLLTITADPGKDLKRGSALALQCTLLCNGGIADCSSVPDNVELTWVDDEGTALQGDRFKITPYRTHSTLSLELQKSDHDRRWRCDLTEGGEVKASYSYTTTLTDNHDQDEELTKESISEIPAQVTIGDQSPQSNGFCVPATNQIRKHVFVETGMTWSEAQSYCREMHTDLATVRSQEEAEQLLNITGDSLNDAAWIGLYRDDTQNWQWSNSDDVIYSNWKAELFCASVSSLGEWEDLLCNEKKAFMCYNETSNITERYTLIEELKTWTEAQQYCREHHTDLVSIKSASENEDLVKKAQGKTFWIGLFNEPWKWSNQGDNYTFHNWNTGEPNNVFGIENCAIMSLRNSLFLSRGKWVDVVCGGILPFFCYEVPEELHLISDSMVWPEAWQYCRDHYTDLVSLTSLAAQNRVSELVRNSTASRFWIGLHRTVVYDNWYWVAGKDKRAPLNYTNWAPGEPNNPYYEHCGEMVLGEDGGAEWNDLCCYEKLPFICFKG
ncbi:UNVERIFIED_CONTAM: hypothetical protein FKN15_022576 [Acipenser sinensis]